MNPLLTALHRLQEVESQLVRLRNERSRLETAVRAAERRLAEVDHQIAAKADEIREQQLRAQRLESEVRAREEQIAKLRQQLNTTRTSREYAAILTQINTEKADTSKIEEQAIQALQEIDKLKEEVQQIKQQKAQLQTRLQQAKQRLQEFLEQTAPQWQELEQRKEELARDLPHEVLELFERVAEHYEGEALARVVRTHPKRDEFVCDGCHMSITMEQVNALMTRDEIQTCHSCGRILYLDVPAELKRSESAGQ